MDLKVWLLLCFCALSPAFLPGMTVEDDFKSYPDYDSAHRSWMFRGVGGEVVNKAYRFNGVSIDRSVEGDVHPTLTMGIPRDFPAGARLTVNAEFTLGSQGFTFLDLKKKEQRSIGVAILDRQFSRGRRDPMDIPTLRLSVEESPDGKRSVLFSYAGNPALSPKLEVARNSVPAEAAELQFSLELSGDTATGVIRGGGKELFRGTLRDARFREIFPAAYPAFLNMRMPGALTRFQADNHDSRLNAPQFATLPLPANWQLKAEGKTLTVIPDASGKIDIAGAIGTFGPGKKAVLECEVVAPAPGLYAAGARGDWFWKLSANGAVAIDLTRNGNGNGEHVVELNLNAGKNRLTVEINSGSGGWNFQLTTPNPEVVKAKEAALHLYGADRVIWNLDRMIDDLNNLKRWKIANPELETEILKARREIPATLSAADAKQYDPRFDEWYGKIYDLYRVVHFYDLYREISGISAMLGKEIPGKQELETLGSQLLKAASTGDSGRMEELARTIQDKIDGIRAGQEGFREGVTFGRSFGRFGWLTGDKVSSYSSGDGLLVNQLLSSGALLRQFVNAADGKTPWQLRFRFAGERDPRKAAELDALPTVGENTEVEFGYDPSNFYSGSTPSEVKVKAINWVRKKFSYGDNFTADMSLLSPALLLESASNTFLFDDPSTSGYTHMGFRRGDGKIVSMPVSEGTLYDLDGNGGFGGNWVLFWSESNADTDLAGHRGCVPLQLIFQHQPRKIEKEGGRYRVTLGKNGALFLNTPFGARLQPAGNWLGNLPPAAAGRCDVHGRAALAYPTEVREYHRELDGDRVEIVNQFTYRHFKENDWNLAPLELATLPPVLSLLTTERKFDAEFPSGTFDLGYPTIYGPLLAVPGNTARYTLPVPKAPRVLLPRDPAADPALVAELVNWNKSALEGNRFRFYCENVARSFHSLTPLAPFAMSTKSWSYLPEDFKAYSTVQFDHQMEQAASYRGYRFWRSLCEPYSGAKYFYSFSIACRNPGDVGVFGDRGYGVANHMMVLDLLSSYSGSYERLRKIWRDDAPLGSPMAIRDGETVTVDKMQGYLRMVHDWAWMEAGSNDNGDNGPVVDCGQAVFGGVAALYRMSRQLGNEEEKARAAYHLAKSQLSQIGRPAFREYGNSTGTLGLDYINAGFREFITPHSYANSPMIGKTPRNEYDGSLDSLFCYAYIDYPDIYFPYAEYVWQDLRYYEKARALYWPNRDRGANSMMGHLYSRLVYLMLDGTPQSRALELLDHWTKKSVFYERSGAVRETAPFAMTGGSPLTLTDWYPAPAPEFIFDSAKKSATVRFGENTPETLRAISSFKPASVLADGKPVEFSYSEATYELSLPLPANTRNVEFLYTEIRPGRLELFPVPAVPQQIPAAPGIDPESFEAAPPGKPVAPSKEKLLYRSDFSGSAAKGEWVAGWSFNSWGDPKNPLSGGTTGVTGTPSEALEICAVPVNYAGRASKRIEIPLGIKELVLRGEIILSADYRGNVPITFFWTGKSAHFFDLPRKSGKFEVILPAAQMPAGTNGVNLQFASKFDNAGATPTGSIYLKSVTLSAR